MKKITMREEKYKITYGDYNFNINTYDLENDKYMKEMLKYKVDIKPTTEEVLDGIDINVIEKYLRKKKLENLANK